MATQGEVIGQIRDAASSNAAALALILADAQRNFQAIRLWADSPTKRAMLLRLNDVISTADAARREYIDLNRTAAEAAAATGSPATPTPSQPAPSEGGVSPTWAQTDW